MDLSDKLRILADAAKYDASCASSGAKRSNGGRGLGNATGTGICHSYTPDGPCVSLLKILLTNACIHDCRYCVNRIGNDVPRAAFSVDEVVQLTIDFYKRNYIEGLFLSSGVAGDAGGERFVAWHRPRHRIVAREADFFVKRFPEMAWSILTPHGSAHWDTQDLCFGPGAPAGAAPSPEEIEDLWVTYYGAIFDPARVKLAAMVAEMPKHHWATLPETRAIPELLADVPRRLQEMADRAGSVAESAAPFVPAAAADLDSLRSALPQCGGCALCNDGTRPVFGEGPGEARIVLLGEQPGDQEEREGRPFVGPAGRLLDEVLAEAGLSRDSLYVTNAVKHFAHRVEVTPRGKRRLHARPRHRIVSQCQPWLDAEMALVRPVVLVCLGSTAARATFGPSFRLLEQRGIVRRSRYASTTLATHHPAALLRTPCETRTAAMRTEMVEDLRAALRHSELPPDRP